MMQFCPRYKQFKALVDAKDYENAVRSGLDYLRFVADEYIRLEDADTYLADLDKQIKHHTYEYKRLVNDEYFDQLNSMFRFEELVYQPCNRRITDASELCQVEELWLYSG